MPFKTRALRISGVFEQSSSMLAGHTTEKQTSVRKVPRLTLQFHYFWSFYVSVLPGWFFCLAPCWFIYSSPSSHEHWLKVQCAWAVRTGGLQRWTELEGLTVGTTDIKSPYAKIWLVCNRDNNCIYGSHIREETKQWPFSKTIPQIRDILTCGMFSFIDQRLYHICFKNKSASSVCVTCWAAECENDPSIKLGLSGTHLPREGIVQMESYKS